MKKLLVFAFMILPMTAFAASSVRVLGTGVTPGAGAKTTTTNSGATKVTPAKVMAAKPAAASTSSTAATTPSSRIGTIRAKPKVTTGTISASSNTNTAGSRFPVITPAHSYNTVGKQQASGGNTSGSNVSSETVILDDPRFDMIHVNSREDYWRQRNNALVNQRESEGYVFMWIEE